MNGSTVESPSCEPSDVALIESLAVGELRCLATLYDRYGRLAYWLANQMLDDGPAAEDVVYRFFGHVADTDEEARRNVGDIRLDLGRFFGMNPAILKRLAGDRPLEIHAMERPFLCGGPATVVDQVGDLRDAGVGNLDMAFTWPGISYEQQLRSMECFASRVIPQIRAL